MTRIFENEYYICKAITLTTITLLSACFNSDLYAMKKML